MRRDLSLMLREVCSEKELLTAMNCNPLKKRYIRLEKLFMTSRSMRAINIWISRFLKMGIDGLINKPKLKRPRVL